MEEEEETPQRRKVLQLCHAAIHTFFPRNVPRSEESKDKIRDYEGYLLEGMLDMILETSRKHGDFLSRTKHCFQHWTKLQSDCIPTDPVAKSNFESFHKTLKSLSVNRSLAVYIRAQNCTMLLTKLDDKWMRIITFRASLPSKEIMSSVGSLQVTYPETINVIPISDLLLSPCFAQQIRNLTLESCGIAMPISIKAGMKFTEVRDVSEPSVVSELIVTLLNPISSTESMKMFPGRTQVQIRKKVRDVVNWKDCLVPFRRSGLWMSAKVILQLMLAEDLLNVKDALVVYKCLLLRMLTFICKEFQHNQDILNRDHSHKNATYIFPNEVFDTDFPRQMLVKLARRAKKLSRMTSCTEQSGMINDIKNATLEYAYQLIDTVHENISKHWKIECALESSRRVIEKVSRSGQDFLGDLRHDMTALNDYFDSERNPKSSSSVDGLAEIDNVKRCLTLSSILSRVGNLTTNGDVHMNEKSIWIYDVERFVLLHLGRSSSSKDVYNLLEKYTEQVLKLYGDQYKDPVAFSRMTLTVLKIIQILDKIAVDKHPLLKQYRCGIMTSKFDSLLLNEKQDMDQLGAIFDYFKARDRAALYPSLIEEGFVDSSSFSVRYAETCASMIALRTKILEETEAAIQQKYEEVDEAKKRCNELQSQIDSTKCKYEWSFYYERSEHVTPCKHCNLKRQLKNEKQSVSLYQRPLPERQDLQYAVVFELQIPEAIACLRDSLSLFVGDILNEVVFGGLTSKNIYTQWSTFGDLTRICERSWPTSTVSHLGSTVKSTLSTHYGKGDPNVMTTHKSSFIVHNGLNCNYYIEPKLNFKIPEGVVTFQIDNTSEKSSKPYENLQFSLNSTMHTDNDAISIQYICHRDLSLKEFITYGSLRAGHRIQLRNLYAAISSNTVSFEKEPVLALILQSLWEIGPERNGDRESHVDFCDEPFSTEFLCLLENSIRVNATNWSHPLVMLSFIVIIIRILELNEAEQVRRKCLKLLQTCREILKKWSEEINDLLSNSNNAPIDEQKYLLGLLLQINMSAAFTFNVSSPKLLQYVISDGTSVMRWLEVVSTMHHLVVREKVHERFSSFLSNLLRHARVDIALNIEEHLHKKIQTNLEIITDYVCERWGDAKLYPPERKTFTRCPTPKSHTYEYSLMTTETALVEHVVHIDILRGTFLVDGHPPSYLPESITRHPLFQRFFLSCQFKVQPDSTKFKTSDTYAGYHYQFFKTAKNELIIRQLHDDHYLELLPPELFSDEIDTHFIQNYTHWLHSTKKQVYLREKPSRTNYDYGRQQDITQYELLFLDGQRGQMMFKDNTGSNLSENNILSINSMGFAIVTGLLANLELKEYIDVHVEQCRGDKILLKITAKLRRMNLKFELRNGQLYSLNYSNYYISPEQSIGTLIGLQSGILLEMVTPSELSGKKKMILVPHGEISIMSRGRRHHQNVHVPFETDGTIRHPLFFPLEVDQTLKRLKAGNDKSAWFYLALLHAATSSNLPDPLTGLTGVEMAMWILQSGFTFSSSPYDYECLKTLEMIKKLAPVREYYPSHLESMQRINWPQGLEYNTYPAYDGFGIAVRNLIQDSLRLEGLFRKQPSSKEKQEDEQNNSCQKLQEKAYFRHVNMYNQAAHVPNFDRATDVVISTVRSLTTNQCSNIEDLQKLAQVRMAMEPLQPSNSRCFSHLLMTDDELPDTSESHVHCWGIHSWLKLKMRKHWVALYSTALAAKEEGVDATHELTMILGAMLFSGKKILDNVITIHNISYFCNKGYNFPCPIKPLEKLNRFIPARNKFVESEIKDILTEATISLPKSSSDFKTYEKYLEAVQDHERKLQKEISAAATSVFNYWPRDLITEREMSSEIYGKSLKLEKLFSEINSKFKFWYNNYLFQQFVNKIEVEIGKAYVQIQTFHVSTQTLYPQLRVFTVADSPDNWGTTNDEAFQCLLNTSEFEVTSKEAFQIFETGQIQLHENSNSDEKRQQCEILIRKFTKLLKSIMTNTALTKTFDKAGILARRAPVIILRNLMSPVEERCHSNDMREDYFYNYTGALSVLFSAVKRFNRIIKYEENPNKYSVELEREMETTGCENWSPKEHPEWLLLQLELDITIRPIQVSVAKHMMNMPDRWRNGVMQLNMGEGKTSVIVPMICTALSTKEMMCRVTVLSSIFETNQTLLAFTIGGFVNRRVYIFPCRRDMETLPEYLSQIQDIYKECLDRKGVVLTLPEYRLSFRLMIYNHFYFQQQEKYESGIKFNEIEQWLRQHCRDIVDESDEIFSVKYQLIYTTGKQLKLEGNNLRWRVCQKVLQLLPEIASGLFDKYGENVIEFHKEYAERNSEQFTHFRILSDVCKDDLCEMVADAVLEGKVNLLKIILKDKERSLVKQFLVDEKMSKRKHNAALKIFEENELVSQTLLLLSGYLRRGILFTALCKRWRVECGVNESSSKQMAVPFRAKDVAAERTEFGHPDVAIVLSQLSYYYSGLTDEQLLRVFAVLEHITGPQTIYASWIAMIPPGKHVDDTVKDYMGINLRDYKQRTEHLFPILRKHKAVIDFWLENVVFPKESKQFPGKIVTNAWDLCYERNKYPTTGFSGTNDTSLLLPGTISQQDLEELKKTNKQVEATLKQSENKYRRSLRMGIGCRQILEFLTEDGIQVLVDSGALMLELGNEQVAALWLEVDKDCDGVVYFSKDNKLLIKVRSSGNTIKCEDMPFKLSSFVDKVDNCRIYLDDQHCRGTDLKLPSNFKACVTVGSGMRRDKLIQACMRMRKLGKGQSVHFYLSHEVHNKVLEWMGNNNRRKDIATKDILGWVCQNSKEFEKDGLMYWTLSALNYAQKLGADDIFNAGDKLDSNNAKRLAEHCEDAEVLSLQKMYGKYHQHQKVVDLLPKMFMKVKQKLQSGGGGAKRVPEMVNKSIESIQRKVQARCTKHIPNRTFANCMLDEEQEKELEPEHEEESERERPPKETPLKPILHPNVKSFILYGGTLSPDMPGIVKLADIFKRTTFWEKIQPDYWGSAAFASEDFTRVVETQDSDKLDCFLRPLQYLATWTPNQQSEEGGQVILLLSPYEVNELIPSLRSTAAVTLHMFCGRSMDGQDILVNKRRLQVSSRGINGGVHLDHDKIAPYLIAAGNLYFVSMREQKAFVNFLGFAPRPWGEEEEQAFQEGVITESGFVMPNERFQSLRRSSLFTRDPTEMVRAILKCRNDVVRDEDHTMQILDQRRLLEMGDVTA